MLAIGLILLPLLAECQYHTHGCNNSQIPLGEDCIQLVETRISFTEAKRICWESGGKLVELGHLETLKVIIPKLKFGSGYWVELSPYLKHLLYQLEHNQGQSHRRMYHTSTECPAIFSPHQYRTHTPECDETMGFICSFHPKRLKRKPRNFCPLLKCSWRARKDNSNSNSNKKPQATASDGSVITVTPPNLEMFTPLKQETLKNMTHEMAVQATAEIVNQLLNVVQDIWDVSLVVKASEILNQLTNNTEFLSPEAQVNSSEILLHLSEQFSETILQGTDISTQVVIEAAHSLFQSFDSMMGASLENFENLTSVQMDQILHSSMSSMEYLEDALLSLSENASHSYSFSSSLSSMAVSRVNASDLHAKQFSTELPAISRVIFPPSSVLDNVTDNQTLHVQVLALTTNPFRHISQTAIEGPVVKIMLSTEEDQMDVGNLTEYIEIVLLRNNSPSPDLVKTNLTKDQDISVAVNVTSLEEYVVFTVEPEISLPLMLYLGFQEQPDSNHFIENSSLPDSDGYTWVLSPEHLKNGSGTYYITVTVSNESIWHERQLISLSINTFATNCLYWDEQQRAWNSEGCHVGARSSLAETSCLCNHLTFFGSTFFVMPHVVDIRDTLKLFANAMKNPVGLALLGALLGFFIMVIIWAWRKDNEDMKKVRVAILTDNDPAFHFRYVIKVCTGHRIGAGTTSQVVVTLYGAEGQSDPHLLADSEKQLFRSGAVDVFLLKTRYLGELHSLRLWHSNSGNSPSWYVHRVTVTDMSTQRTWYFLCNSWISADLADCQLDRIYSAATKRDLMSLRYLLFSGSVEKFLKDHLWLSIWTRCPWSPFSRVQRICCCMSLLFCSLIINIMFWKQNEDNEAPPGQFPITLTEIKISIQSSIMLLPLNILIVQMFQLIQVPVKQVNLPSNKLRVSLAPRPTSKEATTEHLLEDFIDLVDFLHKYVVQVLGESPEDLMASNTASLLQHIDALSSLVKSYICVHGPNQENPTRVTVLKVHQYHFLHYLKKTLEKLQFQVASVDLTYVPKPINYIQATNVLYDLRDLLQSQSISGETLPNSLTTSFPAFTAQRTLSSRLPKCFQYLCWLLLFAISSFSAFYLALLTLDMTRENATRWLVSILLSLCQSLFVLPPLKVLAQTVFQFRVLRRNNIDDATEEQQLHGILSHFASRPDWQLSGWRNPDNPLYQAPANKSITGLKTQRMMEMRLYKLIQEIIVNVVFLIMIMIMAYSEKSPNEFNLNRAITNSFSSTFNIIGNIQDFYSWSHVTLLPNLYSQYPGFITDGNCFLLGSPRIRQVRRILGSAGDQSRYNSEDTGSYGTGWSPLNSSNTEDDKWKYYTEKELGGYPIWTQLGWYSGGGYVVELGMNRSYASSMLDWLEMSKWLDGYTKAVFLEFNVYNANVNLFCVATFILETNMIGNFMTSTDLQIMRLYQTTGNIFTLQFVSEIICLIIVLYTIVQQGLHLKAEKLSYFRKSKNLLDLSIIMICCCISALYVKKIFLRRRDIDRYHLDHSRFVSLYETATIDCIHGYSVAFLVSLVTVKLWSLLSLNPNLHLITVTLQKAWSEISGFLLTILILLVAYSITCNLLFGWSISNYKSFFESAVTIISLIIGIFDYEEVLTLDPILGSLLITTCVIFLIFVVVNILLSAMLMVFSQERKNPTPYKDREIVELLVLKLSGLLGVRKKPNDSEASAADKDKGT